MVESIGKQKNLSIDIVEYEWHCMQRRRNSTPQKLIDRKFYNKKKLFAKQTQDF